MTNLPLADIVVILLYLGFVTWLGLRCSKKNHTSDDYFLGGRRMPGWAIGISMIGTSISSISFLALPATAFILDWRLFTKHLALPTGLIFAFIVFIPLFRHWNGTTIFEYLEKRFGPLVRTYAALCFIFLQLIRVGSILYLVAIPVSMMLQIPILWVIYGGGAFIMLYTVAGGLEAVVWTDVMQTAILFLGGLLSLVFIVHGLPDGLGSVFSVGAEFDKFSLGEMRFDLNDRTFYTLVLAGLLGGIGHFGTSQEVVQRYLACSSVREAKKAAAIGGLAMIPIWAFFFFIGTALFVYYHINPNPAVAGLEADQVFPYFILHRLPAGVTGLIIAAVLAAAMSSLDSNLNAISTVITIDIVKRYFAKDRPDKFYLKTGKLLTVAAGIVMLVGAHIFLVIPKESMADLNIIIPSVFGGASLGLFITGIFFSKVRRMPVLIGIVVATLLNIYYALGLLGVLPEAWQIPIHGYLAGMMVNGCLMVTALLVNPLFQKNGEFEKVSPYSFKAFRELQRQGATKDD